MMLNKDRVVVFEQKFFNTQTGKTLRKKRVNVHSIFKPFGELVMVGLLMVPEILNNHLGCMKTPRKHQAQLMSPISSPSTAVKTSY